MDSQGYVVDHSDWHPKVAQPTRSSMAPRLGPRSSYIGIPDVPGSLTSVLDTMLGQFYLIAAMGLVPVAAEMLPIGARGSGFLCVRVCCEVVQISARFRRKEGIVSCSNDS